LVQDLDEFVTELRAKGVEVGEPTDVHLGMRAVILTDPDDHRVAIQAPTYASSEWLKKMVS
jgi:hypothetical protein